MAKYRIPVEEAFSWQRPVASILSDPPATPAKGDRYLVGAAATGDWTGHDEEIVTYDGVGWEFMIPNEGTICWILDEKVPYVFSQNAWIKLLADQTSNVTYKIADYTIQLSDFMVLVDATAGAVNITVPSNGTEFEIIKVDSTINSVNLIVAPNSIIGKTSLEIDVPFTAIRIRRYGSVWYVT